MACVTTVARQATGTAIVVGGSLAGTLAALALSEFCDRVVVIERDRYPGLPVPRPGVRQAHHAHLLLESGLRGLEQLLPGIHADLRMAGAVDVTLGADLRWLSSAGPMAKHQSPFAFLSCARAALDHVVRARVRAAAPSIQFLQAVDVVGLSGSPAAISGVRARFRDSGHVEELPAELVVDASGRNSSIQHWLTDIGCAPIPEERVDAGCAYVSRVVYRNDSLAEFGCSAVYVQTRPEQPRTGSVLPIDNDKWIVSLGGMRGSEPGRGEEGFRAMLDSLRDPVFRQVVSNATPASRVWGFRAGPSMRRRLHHAPDGLVAVGDASVVVNPVYGQGMTLAIRGALALRDAAQRYDGIGHRTARAARVRILADSRDAWIMSAAEDARHPATVGAPTGSLIRTQHRYLDCVLRQACHDPQVAAAFAGVMSLVDSPATLVSPRIARRVLLGDRRRR